MQLLDRELARPGDQGEPVELRELPPGPLSYLHLTPAAPAIRGLQNCRYPAREVLGQRRSFGHICPVQSTSEVEYRVPGRIERPISSTNVKP